MPTIHGNRRVLLPVYLSVLGTWASYALVVVVLPFRFQALGLSVADYGIALGVYALGTLITEGLWGYFAFRIGAPVPLGGLAVVTAATLLVLGFAHTLGSLVIVLGLYGMLVVYSTPLIRWIGMNASGPRSASRGLGLLGLFFGVGLTAGTAVGPVLYSWGGFWANLYVGAALLLLATVPLLAVPWNAVSLPASRSSPSGVVRPMLERSFVVATVLVVLYFMVYTLVTNFLQYYSTAVFHGTIEAAGYVIAGARAIALATGVVVGTYVDRWGASRVAPAGFALLIVGAVGTWLSTSYADMLIAALVTATGAGWLSVTLLPMALAKIAPSDQGTGVGVFGSFEDLGLILGPLGIGVVYSASGPRSAFLLAVVWALIALAVALATRRVWTARESSGPPAPAAR